jgi:nucleotide-binding universal stress UspA family protein
MLEKILVSLDGSELSEMSIPYAKELAIAFISEVHLVSVCEKHDSEYRRMVQLYIERVAEQLRSDFEKSGSIATVNPVVLDGEPAPEIVRYAQQTQVSLVIITSHGHSGIMPWVMGSTANNVIHSTHLATLLVRASMFNSKHRPVRIFSRILLPLDGSDVGESALPYVSEIAKKLKSEVIILSVIESGQHVHTIGGQDYIRFPEQQIESTRTETDKYLARIYKKLSDNGVNVRSVLKEGNAAEEIIKFAKESNISLVAMSSHGRTGMRGWVFGSISNKVLQVGKTPLLLVRAPQLTI